MRLQLKSTESNVHKLKDEMAKMKSLVAQNRAACANEVRKRDRQIDSLKKAVVDAGRVRGGNKNRDVVSITVVGDVGVESEDEGVSRGGTEQEEYNLRMETNEFLTELAKSLSEENSTLLNLVHRTVNSLREMSGLQRALDESTRPATQDAYAAAQPHRNAEEVASELEGILAHLKTILTNPSFVPIEEVEIRETEIARLREGWERMEARWKDAVHMMDGWRQRMATNGKPVNMEELQMGLSLSPVRVASAREIAETQDMPFQELSCVQEEEEEEEEDVARMQRPQSPNPAESLHLVPAPGYEAEDQGEDSDQSSIFQDDVDLDELEVSEPNVQVLQESTATSISSPPLPIPPQLSPLKHSYSSANRGSQGSNSESLRKRPGDFTTIVEEKTWELAAAANKAPAPPPHAVRPQRSLKNLKAALDVQEQLKPSSTNSYDSTLFGESYESPIRSNPSRKLFSKPAPIALDKGADHKVAAESGTERPAKSSDEKIVDTAVSPTGPPKPANSSKPKANKRTTSAPAATTKKSTVPPEKTTSKSAGTANPRNRSPVRPPVPAPAPVPVPGSSSRLPRRNGPPVQQSPITMAAINAKLEATERQADAARVRAKLRAARTGRKPTTTTTTTSTAMPPSKPSPKKESTDPVKKDIPVPTVRQVKPEEDELAKPEDDVQDRQLKPEKRKRERRPSKVVSRRRSTLSPWELESLIQGNVEGVSSPAR